MSEQIHRPLDVPEGPPRRRRRLWPHLRGMIWLISLPLVFVVAAAVMMIGQEITAPSWIKTRVEAEAGRMLGGGAIRFGEITVSVDTDFHPRIHLSNVTLRDARGDRLARVADLRAQVSPRGLLFARSLLVQEVSLSGGEIALTRSRDGSLALAFDLSGDAVSRADTLAGLLDAVDTAFATPALEALERVDVDGVIINYTDLRAGRSWTVDGGEITLEVSDDALDMAASMTVLSGGATTTGISARYRSRRGVRAAEARLSIENARSADLASQSPALSWLSLIDAPISGAMRATVEEGGVLGPLSVSLDIGAGKAMATRSAAPLPFTSARTYLTYDPNRGRISFDLIRAEAEAGRISAEGHADLGDLDNGLPEELIGQFTVTEAVGNPGGLYEAPIALDRVFADVRLRLQPFALDIGQIVLDAGEITAQMAGRVDLGDDGWRVALDAAVPEVDPAELLTFWPKSWKPRSRAWVDTNILAGRLQNLALALRRDGPGAPRVAATFDIADTDVRILRTVPPLTGLQGWGEIAEGGLTLVAEQGRITAPQGGRIDATGTVLSVPEILRPFPPAQVSLSLDGTITAMLSILDLEPFRFLTKANRPVTLAGGRASAEGILELPLGRKSEAGEVSFDMAATLRGVRSEVLVPGRVLTAGALDLHASNSELSIEGPMRLDDVPISALWRQPLGRGAGPGQITGSAAVTSNTLRSFGVRLPEGFLRGEGRAQFTLDLPRGEPPRLTAQSGLRGLRLALPALGWSKPAQTGGTLSVAATLASPPRIDRLALSAPGLEAVGDIRLNAGGGLDRAAFSRVSVGNWLDAPVTITGRGQGRPVGIAVTGGTLDLRRANFSDGGGGDGGTGTGPLSVALDRLEIAQGIALTGFRGEFASAGGFSGNFTGEVNGGTALRGSLASFDEGVGVRILSDNAGGVLRSAGMFRNTRKGTLDLTLLPTGAEGTYDGTLAIRDIRLRDAPAMAALLDAISVVGLLQQLDGNGLLFTDVDGRFRLTPNRVIVTEASAVGPSLGISIDGFFGLADKVMDFQGVISPIYLLNGIGAVLTRQGEGLFGFNFRLGGTTQAPEVSVNPLSILTPGMFREIFRRPPPVVTQ